MSIKSLIAAVGASSSLFAATLSAQSANAVRLQLAPGSQLSFEGTSTLHGFTCTTKTMQAYIDVDPAYQTANLSTLAHPIVAVQIVIPVRSLSCGGELENNMFKTLNASQYPYIIYKLSTYDVAGGSGAASSFTAVTQGHLTISGKENPIALNISASRIADGLVAATGEQGIKMSEFGIKPPTFMLGTLRVGNALKVKFAIRATSAAVASAMADLGTRLATAATVSASSVASKQ